MTDEPLTQSVGDEPHRRDLVAIGASAGGVEALRTFAGLLHEDFEPTVLVVVHRTTRGPARLADILDDAGPLDARFAEDGIPLDAGCIYVAPPDRHLMVSGSTIRITDGARVNRTRPAIDPLFFTAAAYGSRTIGVLMSGLLEDGVAGMCGIGAAGGVCIIQDPDDASHGDLPDNARRQCAVDYRLPIDEMVPVLTDLSVDEIPSANLPDSIRREADWMLHDHPSIAEFERDSESTNQSCPECGGPLRRVESHHLPTRFRCHTGHTLGPLSLLDEQQDEMERTLWEALRSLEEHERLFREEAVRQFSVPYTERADEIREDIESLRNLLSNVTRPGQLGDG